MLFYVHIFLSFGLCGDIFSRFRMHTQFCFYSKKEIIAYISSRMHCKYLLYGGSGQQGSVFTFTHVHLTVLKSEMLSDVLLP